MPEFLMGIYNYYYIILILQGICVIHSIRKGNQQKWIWIIVFVPVIGSIAYLFTEIIKRRHLSSIQSGVASAVNPTGRVKDLEKKFEFSDTFANRVALGDAYLANGLYDKAIELYEPGLTGVFQSNEHLINQLSFAYSKVNRYEDIARICPRITNTLNFAKSPTNLLFAQALEKTGDMKAADKQFQTMNGRFSNYEQRYLYGEFLMRQQRKEDAAIVFNDIIEESKHMNRTEKGRSKVWIDKANAEWIKLMSN